MFVDCQDACWAVKAHARLLNLSGVTHDAEPDGELCYKQVCSVSAQAHCQVEDKVREHPEGGLLGRYKKLCRDLTDSPLNWARLQLADVPLITAWICPSSRQSRSFFFFFFF